MGFERFTPVSSVRARLWLAAAMWSVVGLGLLAAGTGWIVADGGRWWGLWLLPALGLGWLKSRLLLEPRAAANSRRIVAAGPRRCLGGCFGWPSWVFVATMVAIGAGLRRSAFPRIWLGVVYGTVGVALLLASRVAWRAWWLERVETAPAERPPRT